MYVKTNKYILHIQTDINYIHKTLYRVCFLFYFVINSDYLVFSTAIVCDLLPEIENGEISYSPPPGEEDLTVGVDNVATYSCNRGYRLIGPEMRTCEDVGAGITGEFSDTEPSCERKSVFVSGNGFVFKIEE